LIGMGGIMTSTDAIEFLLAGATAVAVGTSTFVNPTGVLDVARGIKQYLAENDMSDMNDLIGAVEA
jgi:dihydroorotate dehydrogenase (NAD+) catalytic subunit